MSETTQVIMEIQIILKGEPIRKITFFDWTIYLQADLTAITDHHEKIMVILEPSI